MSSNVNKLIFWLVIVCLVIILYTVVKPGSKKVEQPLTFSQFLTAVEAGKIKKVQITANEVKGDFVDEGEGTLRTLIPNNYPDVYKMLRDKNVNVEIKEASNANMIVDHQLHSLYPVAGAVLLHDPPDAERGE